MIGVNDLLWTVVPLQRTVKWQACFFKTLQQASQFCSGHEDDKQPASGSFVILLLSFSYHAGSHSRVKSSGGLDSCALYSLQSQHACMNFGVKVREGF